MAAAVLKESIRDFSISVPKLNCAVGVIKGLSGPARRYEDSERDMPVDKGQAGQADPWRNRLRRKKKVVTDGVQLASTTDDTDSESTEEEDDAWVVEIGRGRGRGKGKRRVRHRRRVVHWRADSSDDTTGTEDFADSSDYRKGPGKKVRLRFSPSPLVTKGQGKPGSEKPTTPWHSSHLKVDSYATPPRASRRQKLHKDMGKHSTVQALLSPHCMWSSRGERSSSQTSRSVAAFKHTVPMGTIVGRVKAEQSSATGEEFSDREQARSASDRGKNSPYLLRSHKWSQAVSSVSSSPVSGVASTREEQVEQSSPWQRKRKRLLRRDTSESDESQSTQSDSRAARVTRSRVARYNPMKRQRLNTESEESNTEHAMKEPQLTTESDRSSTDRLRMRKSINVEVVKAKLAKRGSSRHAVERGRRLTDSEETGKESRQPITVLKRQGRQTSEPQKKHGRSIEQTATEGSEVSMSVGRAATHHRRRKQETPMRKGRGEKVEAAVQFMHIKHKTAQKNKHGRKEGMAGSPARAVGTSSGVKTNRVKKRGTSSQGQGGRKGGSHQHSADLSSSSSSSSSSPTIPSHMLAPVRSSGEVVDLAGEHVELTQPATQWDYVAVEAIAASEVVPIASDSTAGDSPTVHTPLESIRSIRRPRI